VTGAAPGPAPLLEYLNRKLRPLHVT